MNEHAVVRFYRAPIDGSTKTVFDLWEVHSSNGDSTTPSVASPEYRQKVSRLLAELASPQKGVFSIGCGNGFVEAELINLGIKVSAIDMMQEAVDYARRKGIMANRADFFDLQPGCIDDSSVIYSDGFLGHVFEPQHGLGRFFTKLRALSPAPGIVLVCSFDQPCQGEFQLHPSVPDFYFLSVSLVRSEFERFGFSIQTTIEIPYVRPISGLKLRGLCVGRFVS